MKIYDRIGKVNLFAITLMSIFALLQMAAYSMTEIGVEDLFEAEERNRDGFSSGRIGYTKIKSEYFVDQENLGSDPIIRQSTSDCVYYFSKSGSVLLWRLENKIVSINYEDEGYKEGDVMEFLFDGESFYHSLVRKNSPPYFFVSDENVMNDSVITDIEKTMAYPAVPILFRNRDAYNDMVNKIEIREEIVDENRIKITGYRYGMVGYLAKFDLRYGGQCIYEEVPRLILGTYVTRKEAYDSSMEDGSTTGNAKAFPLLTCPGDMKTFSRFQEIDGIWYPMEMRFRRYQPIKGGQYQIDDIRDVTAPVRLVSESELIVKECDINKDLDNTTFQMKPMENAQVIDQRLGLEYEK